MLTETDWAGEVAPLKAARDQLYPIFGVERVAPPGKFPPRSCVYGMHRHSFTLLTAHLNGRLRQHEARDLDLPLRVGNHSAEILDPFRDCHSPISASETRVASTAANAAAAGGEEGGKEPTKPQEKKKKGEVRAQ